MSEPLITARNLSKTYELGRRSLEVLRSVDLTVNRGDFIALRGASGAGKSTLLHLLGGLDTPNVGEIHFHGRALAGLTPSSMAAFRNRSVGFIFQSFHLLPELDALENVCLPARIGRDLGAAINERAVKLLARVGLKERMDHKPYELSGGEQQRVAIARALINEPELILADEPTGNLDSHTGEGIIDLLCEIQRERQATLIIATHDTRVANRAPRVIQLVDGRIATI
ncbi:MAG: lipoprotein transporter ATP-binding subunit [Verrucomicrobiota bacterium]|jgi:predicted ABC-type transport system involved in lysophospholipase L1 biosynthesis ATPase subunit